MVNFSGIYRLTNNLVLNKSGVARSKMSFDLSGGKKNASLDIAGNYQENVSYLMDEISIGSSVFQKLEIFVGTNQKEAWLPIDGLIGMGIISKFNVWFNYQNNHIMLENLKKVK